MSEEDAQRIRGMVVHGSPDELGERYSKLLETGIDGFTLSAPVNGFREGRVELLGQILSKVVGT
jgi:hypothetical protein